MLAAGPVAGDTAFSLRIDEILKPYATTSFVGLLFLAGNNRDFFRTARLEFEPYGDARVLTIVGGPDHIVLDEVLQILPGSIKIDPTLTVLGVFNIDNESVSMEQPLLLKNGLTVEGGTVTIPGVTNELSNLQTKVDAAALARTQKKKSTIFCLASTRQLELTYSFTAGLKLTRCSLLMQPKDLLI